MTIFAILNHPNGGVLPLMDETGENVAEFAHEDEARKAIESNILGHAYGGTIFDTAMDGTDV